jgi:hypothetical protein
MPGAPRPGPDAKYPSGSSVGPGASFTGLAGASNPGALPQGADASPLMVSGIWITPGVPGATENSGTLAKVTRTGTTSTPAQFTGGAPREGLNLVGLAVLGLPGIVLAWS